jgi:hypothetical protein
MSAGHYALPQIFDYMKNSGLKYWWAIVVVRHNGSSRLPYVIGRWGEETYFEEQNTSFRKNFTFSYASGVLNDRRRSFLSRMK